MPKRNDISSIQPSHPAGGEGRRVCAAISPPRGEGVKGWGFGGDGWALHIWRRKPTPNPLPSGRGLSVLRQNSFLSKEELISLSVSENSLPLGKGLGMGGRR